MAHKQAPHNHSLELCVKASASNNHSYNFASLASSLSTRPYAQYHSIHYANSPTLNQNYPEHIRKYLPFVGVVAVVIVAYPLPAPSILQAS